MRRCVRKAAGAIGFAFGIAGCGEPVAVEPALGASGLADLTDARAVAAGEAVYVAHCATCHGTQLQGQPKWREALPG